jgi:hypothetical protein
MAFTKAFAAQCASLNIAPATGYVIYDGPSLLDGAPIVVIAVIGSGNTKTGDMVQTYILRKDTTPLDALNSGADESICGDCKSRPFLGGDCYVRVEQGATVVFKTLQAGNYPPAAPHNVRQLTKGRGKRLGTYGDPMAVPAWVWEDLVYDYVPNGTVVGKDKHTGYTHQWLNPDIKSGQRERIMALCMASVDTVTEYEMARHLGYRTFRVRTDSQPILPGEFICPASKEAGNKRQCNNCFACDGTDGNDQKANPVIIAHGSKVTWMSRA